MSRHASLNRAFALVWNDKTCAWVPVPEGTRAKGKRHTVVLAAAVTALMSSAAQAAGPLLPTGGQVTQGQAAFQQSGATLTINQTSQAAAIDWQRFSIGAGATVNFRQPSASSVALNRVLGQDPTQILGSLNANGQVFIVNPNGVLFAPGAQVSAAGILASTRDVKSADFAAGRFSLDGSSAAQVVNQGSLTAQPGGYVALVGAQVVNSGTIAAPRGDVRLAAADAVSLRIQGAGLAGFTVERGTLDALAANHGLVRAEGGHVALTADAADALARAVVNHTGVIEAQSVDSRDGVIELRGGAQAGQVNVSGRLDVSAPQGHGGRITATANNVSLQAGAVLDALGASGGGTVLVGGGWQGADASVANAAHVVMDPTARIDVSATGQGNGGTAVLWSQDRTAFAGTIAARGGAQGGHGGRVETSSHDSLQALGAVDVSAPLGTAGSWLLDPRDVTIAASGASGTAFSGSTSYGATSTYTPTADSVILASSIVNSLNAGANVTITTGASGTSAGNITVAAPIVVTGPYGYAPTLTLQAANDINVNALISHNAATYYNRLNVVFTPGSAGNISFSSAGKVVTGGGNFYAGTVTGSGSSETVSRAGQAFTMAPGSLINVSAGTLNPGYAGMLDVQVNGAVTLAANSLINYGGSAYYRDGSYSLAGAYIGLKGASITSANTAAATPDILTRVNTTLQADAIGSSANPIKASAGSSRGYARLSVNNSAGSSYVNEVGEQAFSTIAVNIGSQANSTQDIRILDDFGGDGRSGGGHLLLKTDGAGVLNVLTDDVKTAGTGVSGDYTHSNVEINANSITFADGSVNTGEGYFSASAATMRAAAARNEVAEIAAPDVRLSGSTLGTALNPLELSSGTTTSDGSLTVTQSGGSTFLKAVDDNFTTVNLNHVKGAGTHSILFAGGDHFDYASDGSDTVLPTLSAGRSDGHSFGATSGLDGTGRNRYVSVTALSGGVRFGDNAVNLGAGSFSVLIPQFNGEGTIAAINTYNVGAPVAQITAGDVSLSALNDPTPTITTIGAGGKDIQIAQGAGAVDATLSVSTQQGSVNIHELTQNHFKSIYLSLGKGSLAQTVAIDLAGPDDINFSDSGSRITVDATKVAVAGNNRNFSLTASERTIQADGNALGTGNYSLSANLLQLNSDITTDGGNIGLYGRTGVDLLQSVRVDSNVGRSGAGGNISLSTETSNAAYTVSSTGGSRTLTLDASSSDATGGDISLPSGFNSRAGAFLTGLTLTAAGANATSDGNISLGSGVLPSATSILLKGDFAATGNTWLNGSYGLTLDTEQGNSAAGGSITFAGKDLGSNFYYGALVLNSSTGLAGANGGNVSLATQHLANRKLEAGSVTVNAGSGSGGVRGDIALGPVSTSTLMDASQAGTQSYTGRQISLDGDLSTSAHAITLAASEDVRVARSLTISTNTQGYGNSGGVTLAGTGVSATAPGASLSINTSSQSGNGGAVSIAGGANASAGAYLGSLTVTTSGNGGSQGAITLGAAVATEGAQTYGGGTVTVNGGLSTNGGDIDLRNAAGVTLAGSAGSTITFDTDRAGGNNAAGSLRLGSKTLNGNYALAIDTTADGGGASADLTLNGTGNSTAFASINVVAGNVTLAGTTRATGDVTVEARGAASDLTITSAGSVVTTTASTVVLAAGHNFFNNKGATGIAPGSGGRYLVYSGDPASSTEGMSGYSKHYNEGYVAGATPSYAGSGNWFLYRVAPVISVAPNATSIVYGSADPSLVLAGSNYSGFIDGDTLSSVTGSQSLTLAAAGANSGAGYRPVGSYAYTLNGTLTDSLGYQYAPFSASLAVTPRALALSGISAASKVYDGSTTATLTGTATFSSALSGDVVTPVSGGATGSFANANAGTGKAVTVGGYSLSGADASNYTLTQPAGLTADITPKALSISGSAVTSKTYDGGTAAVVAAGTLSGMVNGETLGVAASGQYADKRAGTGKIVATTYLLSNGTGQAGNYTLGGDTLTGDITPKAITVTATGVDKVYDGNTSANATLASAGVVGNDVVTFTGTASFADKNAALGKQIGVSGIGASGTDVGNYTLTNTTAIATADITRKSITVTASGINKVYDGSTAVGSVLTSNGLLNGDSVDFSGTATLADKNVGSGKQVSVAGITAGGTDGANYSVNTTAATTADVTPKAISVTATGVNKVYDGTTAAMASLASAGVVGNDVVTFSGTASFADRNAALGKQISVSGIGASGTDVGNYTLANTTAHTTADITPRAITVTATGIHKVYDGSTAIGAVLASNGLLNGDSVDFTGTAALADKNVGIGKQVGVTGITAGGADGANYSVNTTAATTADVTPKAIAVAAVGIHKVYDGTTTAHVGLTSAGAVSGDDLQFTSTASFADKNAASHKAVSVAGISAHGADAGNYTLTNTTASTTADITPKAITVTAMGASKVYDGTTAATTSLASAGVVGNDVVTFSGTASFADKNAALSKQVSVSGIGIGGADVGNYTLDATTASTTADITPRAISVTATGVNKVYDGSTAVGTLLASNGLLNGDAVEFSGTATLADKNVGIGKQVSVSGITAGGTDGANYSVNTTAATTADVTPKAITVAATGINKLYDGTTIANVGLASAGMVAGDDLRFDGAAAYANKNAAINKAVSVAGISATGSDAGNYTLTNTTAGTTADITPKAIVVTATGVNKVYDGSHAAQATLASAGVLAGDVVSFSGTATLADRNAGIGKRVDIGGITTGGTDGGNYSVNATASTTADVTPRPLSVALQGTVSKADDGNTRAALAPANYALTGVVAGESVAVTRTTGAFADPSVGQGKAVTVTLQSSDYEAGAQTLLSNYALPTGPVSGAIGEVRDAVTTAPAYIGALNARSPASTALAAPLDLATPVTSAEKAVTEGESADTPRQGTARKTEASVVSTNTRENLQMRRTFSVGDGGIRLPAGVKGSDKDASQ